MDTASEGCSLLTAFLSCVLLLILLKMTVQRSKFLYALRKIPYPTALPIIGNAYQLNCSQQDFFKKLVQWSREFGDIHLMWVGMRPFIFLYRVESVQPLLGSSVHIDKSLEYQYLKPWLGTGLVTSTGEKWHSRRKLLTPTFHSGLLDEYLETVLREADVMLSCLAKEIGKEFDIVPYAKRATLDIICDSAMGCHVNAQVNFRNEYVQAVNKLASIVQMRFTNVWISLDPIFKLTRWGKEHDRSLRVIHEFVDKVIAGRRAQWKLQRDGNFNEPSRKRQALLDLLLEMSQDGAALSNGDILEEVNTFMFAGHDTMATSVSWILYALGRRPEYQTKILDEYECVVGSDRLTLEVLSKLVWLEACVKETWRMYPVTPLIARQIYSPISIMGSEIPVGSTVLVNSFLLHRDPRHFPDPEVYKPERFLPGSPKFPCYAFIPFSAGSRNCIGWKFATMAVKVLVLKILRTYRIDAPQPENQLRFVSELVLVNAGGIRLKLTPRGSAIETRNLFPDVFREEISRELS